MKLLNYAILAIPLALLSGCGIGSTPPSATNDTGNGTSSPTPTNTPSPTPADTSSPTPAPTGSPAPTPTPVSQTDHTCGMSNFNYEMLSRVNSYRAAGAVCGTTSFPGVGPVGWNDSLQQAATAHSTDMATNNFFSHTGSNGSAFSQRVQAAGYSYGSAGENIAAGQTSVQSVVDGWINSPPHCANIMKASFVDMGVSCIQNSSSSYKIYWTMELGNP